jgi:dihydrolipoamide dehydrogenase
MFTHVSTYEAPIAVANMLDGAGIRPDYRTMPRAIFTAPELAGAGLSEQQAVAAGYEIDVKRFDVGKSGKSRALGDRRGRIKFVLDAKTGEVLGAHVLARHGADLLPPALVTMNSPQHTLAPLLATTFPHPTLSEAIKIAARDG